MADVVEMVRCKEEIATHQDTSKGPEFEPNQASGREMLDFRYLDRHWQTRCRQLTRRHAEDKARYN